MLESKYKELTAYASAFVAFILPKIDVKEIILFGSVARGEATAGSDIDLFFNIEKEEDSAKIKSIIHKELTKFLKSRIAEIWYLKGIRNEIKIEVGSLANWKLKRSLIAEGILLYGKYKELPEKLHHWVFFNLSPIKNIAQRNRVARALFGRKEKNYSTKGMIEEFSGRKISSLSFIVPIEHANKVINFLSTEKTNYSFFELWSDQL
ncbi:MAG: nucleotidyltransferase domain-containing protein [Candidatus Pacearchaeota archaeon]